MIALKLASLFSGPYGLLVKWGIIAALCASMVGYGWVKGNQHGTEKLTEYQAAQAIAAIKVIKGQDIVTVRIVKEYLDRLIVTAGVTTTIEKEVTKYVDSKPLSLACDLDSRWLSLHDSAAAGTIPETASGNNATPGGVTAAAALPGITGNYARANRNKDKLRFCQRWIREQFKETNGEDLGY